MDALRAGLGDTLAALTAHPAMLLAIIGAVFIAAVVRGFTGFGFMLAAVPLMGLLIREAGGAIACWDGSEPTAGGNVAAQVVMSTLYPNGLPPRLRMAD